MTAKPITREDWELKGPGRMTDAQRKMLNAACGDLAAGIVWHGNNRLTKDDYRHFICGTVLGWTVLPGIDRGDGKPAGFIMLGGSSLDLTRQGATEAIEIAFAIGDHPEGQGLSCGPVSWCDVIRAARGISAADDRDADRYAA